MHDDTSQPSGGVYLFYGFIALLWIAAAAAVYVTFFYDPSEPDADDSPSAVAAEDSSNSAADPSDDAQPRTIVLDADGNIVDPAEADKPIELPEFEFTDQHEQVFGTAQLLGKPWVATFIFTKCPGPCFEISGKMGKLQREMRDYDFQMVSFSVDPKTDTPAMLKKYSEAFTNDAANWHFLTGEQSEIYYLIQKGFKMPVGEVAPGNIIHVNSFVLVDEKGFVVDDFDAWNSEDEYLKLKKKIREITSKKSDAPASESAIDPLE